MSRTSWKMFSPSGLSMNFAPTAWVVTWSEKSSHGIDSAIRRQTRKTVLPVDVGLCERDVGAGGDRPLGVLGGERDRDHPAHRGPVDEAPVEPDGVEQCRAVVGPALDRVLLARVVEAP